MKTVRIILWLVVLVVGATVAGVYVGQTFIAPESRSPAAGLATALAHSQYEEAGGPFRLIDTNGEVVTQEDLRGKPSALFFGFTHCPEVCPTALFDTAGWLDALGEDADKIQFVFVTVDPERDTPQVLQQYVKAFDERIMGLTAESPEAIAEVAERYKIRFEKVPLKNGDYTMNHTADTLLFDADGDFADFIPYLPMSMRQNEKIAAAENDRIIEKLKELVAS